MKRVYIAILSAALTLLSGRSETLVSAEQAVGQQIARCLRFLSFLNTGVVPTNWQALSECLDLKAVDRTVPEIAPIEKSYSFVTEDFRMSMHGQEGRVLLIRNLPVGDAQASERYFIWQTSDSNFVFSHISEAKFEGMLSAVGLQMKSNAIVAKERSVMEEASKESPSSSITPRPQMEDSRGRALVPTEPVIESGSRYWRIIGLSLGIVSLALLAVFGRMRKPSSLLEKTRTPRREL